VPAVGGRSSGEKKKKKVGESEKLCVKGKGDRKKERKI